MISAVYSAEMILIICSGSEAGKKMKYEKKRKEEKEKKRKKRKKRVSQTGVCEGATDGRVDIRENIFLCVVRRDQRGRLGWDFLY